MERPATGLAPLRATRYVRAERDGRPGHSSWLLQGAVWAAKINKSATRCVTAGADFSIRVWDAILGEQAATFDGGHVIKSVDFSSDEKSIIAGGYSCKILVFDLSSDGGDPVLSVAHPTVSAAPSASTSLPQDSTGVAPPRLNQDESET
jgi:WD40 repeat protein